MSRPYPVGEKVAGHKLASLYIIIYNYYVYWLYKSRLYRPYWEIANACALQCDIVEQVLLSPFHALL